MALDFEYSLFLAVFWYHQMLGKQNKKDEVIKWGPYYVQNNIQTF